MNIQFFTEDVEYNLQERQTISSWLQRIVNDHNFTISELNYIFCSDDYLLEINRQHLNHYYYTDIITFDNSDQKGTIESDIFISIDRVRENAINQNVTFTLELNRVMIHGVLHLLGFEDKTDSERNAMREKEDACLSLLKK